MMSRITFSWDTMAWCLRFERYLASFAVRRAGSDFAGAVVDEATFVFFKHSRDGSGLGGDFRRSRVVGGAFDQMNNRKPNHVKFNIIYIIILS